MRNQKRIVGAVILLLGLSAFIFFQQKKATSPTTSDHAAMENKGEDLGSISGTLKDLIARNVPMTCTFATKDETSKLETKGDVYLSGKKMHGNFISVVNGKETHTHMIRDDVYMYTWTSDQPEGMKMKVDQIEEMTKDTMKNAKDAPQAQQATSLDNQNVDYDCSAWLVDEAKFVPPADVKFVDYTEQMEKMQDVMKAAPQGTSGSAAQCAACNQVPAGPSREQCLKSMGC